MADESAQLENGVGGDVDLRRDSHPKQQKHKSSSKMKKVSHSRKERSGRKKEDDSPGQSPTRMDYSRRDDVDLSSLEIISPTGSILHQHEAQHRGKRLDWSFKVSLSAEKVQDPAIYTCELCNFPILIYGRLIPCKHVFCFDCAKNQVEKICPRCKESFSRIEQSALGTVFICTFGGGKQTPRGCKRTYLSQRDLNAHIQHRHNRPATTTPGQPVTLEINPKLVPPNKPSSANLPPSSISQQIASTLPGNIDLSDLSNITDAQLKAAADILAATINASKPAKPAPDAALAMLPQNPYFAPNPAGFPPAQYPPNSNAPMMRIPGAPQHPTPFTNVGTPFQPHPAYQNMPQPATNMVPMNQGGMQSQPGFSQAGPFFPQGRPMSRPPMSGAPNSNFGPGRGPRIGHQALPVSGHGMMQHPPTVNVANAPGRPPPNAMFPAGGPPRGPPPTSSVRPPSVGYY